MTDAGEVRVESLHGDGDGDGVAVIRLCRAAKLNALDARMLEALEAALSAVEESNARAVIVTGEGKLFCAGGDIDAWSKLSPHDFAHRWVRRGHRIFDRLAQLRQVTVAAVNGHAMGGGLELAAACDFRVLDERARLSLPETALGMTPGWSGTQRLARRFGAQTVRRMALAGEVFCADESLARGLADRVAAAGDSLTVAEQLARDILARGPAAVQTAKLMLAAFDGESTAAAVEALAGAAVAGGAELREGVAAFKDKRAPVFKGK